jgi:hypothetical protein
MHPLWIDQALNSSLACWQRRFKSGLIIMLRVVQLIHSSSMTSVLLARRIRPAQRIRNQISRTFTAKAETQSDKDPDLEIIKKSKLIVVLLKLSQTNLSISL